MKLFAVRCQTYLLGIVVPVHASVRREAGFGSWSIGRVEINKTILGKVEHGRLVISTVDFNRFKDLADCTEIVFLREILVR